MSGLAAAVAPAGAIPQGMVRVTEHLRVRALWVRFTDPGKFEFAIREVSDLMESDVVCPHRSSTSGCSANPKVFVMDGGGAWQGFLLIDPVNHVRYQYIKFRSGSSETPAIYVGATDPDQAGGLNIDPFEFTVDVVSTTGPVLTYTYDAPSAFIGTVLAQPIQHSALRRWLGKWGLSRRKCNDCS